MHFTGGRFDSQRRGGQEVVSAMHATLGRGFFVLLNGHVDTPKKSVRLAFQSGQRGERIDPLAGICRTGQATFFVPWGNWQGEEDFILNQLDHIQFSLHRQEIPGVVFQLVLRQIGTFGNKFQQVVDIKIARHRFQAALAGKRDNPRNLQVQHGFTALTLEAPKAERYLSSHFGQQIMQAFKLGNSQRSLENTAISGECESVRNPFQS
jgi:hypothetical protein